MKWQTEFSGSLRRRERGTVANRDNPIERTSRRNQIFELHWDRAVTPRVFEHVATVGCKNQIDSGPGGCAGEFPNLVSGGCREKQNALHTIRVTGGVRASRACDLVAHWNRARTLHMRRSSS
jgi:hypothetical protein